MYTLKCTPLKYHHHQFQTLESKCNPKESLQKVDGTIVVYSVTDTKSFQVAQTLAERLRQDKRIPSAIPVVLLGNKYDLEHSRYILEKKRAF